MALNPDNSPGLVRDAFGMLQTGYHPATGNRQGIGDDTGRYHRETEEESAMIGTDIRRSTAAGKTWQTRTA